MTKEAMLDLVRACGLERDVDYYLAPFPYGVVMTETGERKILALIDDNPALALLFDAATREQMRRNLDHDRRISRRRRHSGEKLLLRLN